VPQVILLQQLKLFLKFEPISTYLSPFPTSVKVKQSSKDILLNLKDFKMIYFVIVHI
jgi:hypothetical protein